MLCPQWGTSLNYCGSAEKEAQQGQTVGTWLWRWVVQQVAGALVLPTLLPPPHCQAELGGGGDDE